MRPDIVPGSAFPDYELPDQHGKKRKLSEIQRNDPMNLATNEFRDGLGAKWPFLSDPKKTVMHDLDIPEYTDTIHNPMAPYTLVLEPVLKIYKIYDGYWYWGRPSVEELRQDLREITRKIRPDWDLFDPKLRAAWKAGDKSKFWPYGKSYDQVFAEED